MSAHSRHLIGPLVVVLSLTALPRAVSAQAGPAPDIAAAPRPTGAARALFRGPELKRFLPSAGELRATAQASRGRSGDSLANGALVGALVGAIALGGFAAVVCKAQQEPNGPSCADDSLRIAAIGAAIGAGAGLAVDASLNRQSGVRVSVRARF
jgi:hypothetical protein